MSPAINSTVGVAQSGAVESAMIGLITPDHLLSEQVESAAPATV